MEKQKTALEIQDFCRVTGIKQSTARERFLRSDYFGWKHDGKITIICPAILLDLVKISPDVSLNQVQSYFPDVGMDFAFDTFPAFASKIKGLEAVYYLVREDGFSMRVYHYIINGKIVPALEYK